MSGAKSRPGRPAAAASASAWRHSGLCSSTSPVATSVNEAGGGGTVGVVRPATAPAAASWSPAAPGKPPPAAGRPPEPDVAACAAATVVPSGTGRSPAVIASTKTSAPPTAATRHRLAVPPDSIPRVIPPAG
jgi:hypothetical protein